MVRCSVAMFLFYLQEENPGGHWDPWSGHHIWSFHIHSQTTCRHQLQTPKPDQRVHCCPADEPLQGKGLTPSWNRNLFNRCYNVAVLTGRQSPEALSSYYWGRACVPCHLRQQRCRSVHASHHQWLVLWVCFSPTKWSLYRLSWIYLFAFFQGTIQKLRLRQRTCLSSARPQIWPR